MADCKEGDKIGLLCYNKCEDKNDNGRIIKYGHLDGIPTQCGPKRGDNVPVSYDISPIAYAPKSVTKIRKYEMSHK
jgi:hypothetical protein